MSTERRQREGIIEENGEPDPLVKALEVTLLKCSKELGVLDCHSCPVEKKCDRLWPMPSKKSKRNLNLTEYRRLDQEFYALKLERDRILEKREKVLAPHKPT